MNKGLIDHIKDSLHEHEETYVPGAWEKFSAQEKRKPKLFYWPLWSAACVLLAVGSFIYFNKDEKAAVVIAKKSSSEILKSNPEKITIRTSTETDVSVSNNSLKADKIIKNNTRVILQKSYLLKEEKNLFVNNSLNKFDSLKTADNKNLTLPISNESMADLNHPDKEVIAKNTVMPKPKSTFEQLLKEDSEKNKLSKTTKSTTATNKWHQDIFIAPAMGNDNKLNMNYGFSLSYNIAIKLSISSGISYNALSSKSEIGGSATGTQNSPASRSALSTNTKNLESVDARLSGINIPLELKYKINKKLYTGVGIAAFAMIKNKQENNYLVSETRNTSVVSTFGLAEQKMLVVTERVSEQQTGQEASKDKYLGFYNFSLGYKQKISPDKNIAIEPFLSLPMKGFSNQRLNFTNGGLRVKFEF